MPEDKIQTPKLDKLLIDIDSVSELPPKISMDLWKAVKEALLEIKAILNK